MEGWGMQMASGMAARGALWGRLLLAIGNGEPAKAAAALPTARRALPRGEIGEFERLFRAHERDIFTYMWRMTSDEQAAYNLAQETFLRAWQHFARIRDYERPGGWLFRVATHLALNHLRNRTTALGAAVSLDAAGGTRNALSQSQTIADLSARVAGTDTVRRALIAISTRQRAALVLREVYGLSVAKSPPLSGGHVRIRLQCHS